MHAAGVSDQELALNEARIITGWDWIEIQTSFNFFGERVRP